MLVHIHPKKFLHVLYYCIKLFADRRMSIYSFRVLPHIPKDSSL